MEFHEGDNCPGGSFPGGNYSGAIIWGEGKSPGGAIVLGRISWAAIVRGQLFIEGVFTESQQTIIKKYFLKSFSSAVIIMIANTNIFNWEGISQRNKMIKAFHFFVKQLHHMI